MFARVLERAGFARGDLAERAGALVDEFCRDAGLSVRAVTVRFGRLEVVASPYQAELLRVSAEQLAAGLREVTGGELGEVRVTARR